MNFSKLIIYTVIFVLVLCVSAIAQDEASKFPEKRAMVGVHVSQSGGAPFGGVGGYFISEEFLLGAKLGFEYDGGPEDGESETFLSFGIFGRLYFEETLSFRPFVEMCLLSNSTPVEIYNQASNRTNIQTQTTESVMLSAGAAWHPYKSVAVIGSISFFDFIFDPTRFRAGIMHPTVGVEWSPW